MEARILLQIAIDGPVASGKTAVGRVLARRLGARFLDTGTMYRAVAWASVERRIDATDWEGLTRLASELDITLNLEDDEQVLMVDGTDVTEFLRVPHVEAVVSAVSEVPGVRSALVGQQRSVAEGDPAGIVVVGRDIGTVVLPKAPVKVFLEASIEIRVRRRHDELRRKGDLRDINQLAEEIELRDKIDSERSDSPLRPALDSVIIETDLLRIDQVVDRVETLVKKL